MLFHAFTVLKLLICMRRMDNLTHTCGIKLDQISQVDQAINIVYQVIGIGRYKARESFPRKSQILERPLTYPFGITRKNTFLIFSTSSAVRRTMHDDNLQSIESNGSIQLYQWLKQVSTTIKFLMLFPGHAYKKIYKIMNRPSQVSTIQ